MILVGVIFSGMDLRDTAAPVVERICNEDGVRTTGKGYDGEEKDMLILVPAICCPSG